MGGMCLKWVSYVLILQTLHPASVLYGSNNHRIPPHVLATCLLEFAKGHTAVWLSKLKGIAAWDWSLQMFGDSSMRNSQTKQNTSWKSGTSIFCCCLCNNIISLGFFQRTPPKSLRIAWEREEVNNIDSSSAQSFAFWPWIKVNGHSKWGNLKYLIHLTQFYWIGLCFTLSGKLDHWRPKIPIIYTEAHWQGKSLQNNNFCCSRLNDLFTKHVGHKVQWFSWVMLLQGSSTGYSYRRSWSSKQILCRFLWLNCIQIKWVHSI